MKNGNIANGSNGIKIEEKESYKTIYKRIIFKHKILILVAILIILITIVGLAIGITLNQKTSEDRRSATSDKLKLPNFRLPSTVFPRHYVLEIKPYLIPDNFKFEGSVKISLECVKKTNEIILHALNLTINEDSVKLQTADNNDVEISGIKYYPEIHFIVIELNQYLNSNSSYQLSLNYSGKMLNDGKGIFYSTFDDQNIKNYLVSTQFEPIYARKAFPCFDEPAMKAKFDIRIIRWENLTSLSNMPKLNTESLKDGWEVDIYQTSMKMSTYLVTIVIGNLTGITKEKISIWTYPDKIDSANFSLNLSPKVLKFFEDLFGIPYEAPKLDMVGLRSDKVIAMENWGLVLYPEQQLLYDEESKLLSKRELISSIIAHELAHQWFGNLVTPKWWSDIWLNEGVSTYMEHIASTSFFPEWNKVDKTLLRISENVESQCSVYSKFKGRVALNIETFEDTNTRKYFFDSDIYNKGAMIIRMAHHILGNETFWKGINKYLKENAYNNVDGDTLWNYLSMAQPVMKRSKENFAERLKPWTKLLGQPVVTVRRNYIENTAIVSQTSCLAKKYKKHKDDLWPIPISYVTQDHWEWKPRITAWLTSQNMKLQNLPQKHHWILVNGHGIGLYIVNYDNTNWKLLSKQLQSDHNVFSVNSRFKLLSDAVILYKLHDIELTTLLDLYLYIGSETELTVLKVEHIMPLLTFSQSMLHMTEENKWKEFVNHIFEPIYNRLGWLIETDTEKDSTILLRNTLFSYLCENGHKDCVNNTRDLFAQWKENRTNIEVIEFQLINFCAVVKYGTRKDWNFIHDLYLVTRNEYFLSPLFCSRDRGLFKRLLVIFRRKEKFHYIKHFFKNIFENKNLWIEFFHFLDNHFEDVTDANELDDLMDYMKTFLRNEVIFNQFESICNKHINELTEKKAKVVKDKLAKFKEKVLRKNQEIYSVSKWLRKEPWLRKDRI